MSKRLTPAQQIRRAKRPKKVDATTFLELRDPNIKRDAKTLRKLLITARSGMGPRRRMARHRHLPTLYHRYRGTGFPLIDFDDRPLLPWRYRTPWMKTQIASLCLHASKARPFVLHLHDQLAEELQAAGIDIKVYLRDRLSRCLRDRFDSVPWFAFAIENRSQTGMSHTRIHVHGEIAIWPAALPTRPDGSATMRSRMLVAQHGEQGAKLEIGRETTWDAMRAATGNEGSRPKIYKERHQNRNMWWRKPMHPCSNEDWISYMFKNTVHASRVLPDNRLCMSRGLNQEAHRLWNLITEGEVAVGQWPQR